MKCAYSLLTLLVTTLSFSQTNICDSLSLKYQEEHNFINDLDAFCQGVNEALEYEGLAWKSAGDPEHVNDCARFSYETYGVKLIFTGDILVGGELEENAGFNAVMKSRIKDSLGSKFDLLGKIASKWIRLTEEELAQEIANMFQFDVQSDSTVLVTLIQANEETSALGSMDGVRFADHTSNWIEKNDFYNGVLLNRRNYGHLFLRLDFNNYYNKNNFCNAVGYFIVPIRFN